MENIKLKNDKEKPGPVFVCDQGHNHKSDEAVKSCNEIWKTERYSWDDCEHPDVFKIKIPIDGYQCSVCNLIMDTPPPPFPVELVKPDVAETVKKIDEAIRISHTRGDANPIYGITIKQTFKEETVKIV